MAKQRAAEGEAIPEEIARLGFEEALAELEAIVQQLEGGEVGLEQSIEIFTRGTQLKRHCEAKLKAASEKVDRILIGPAGEARGSEPADLE